MGKRLVVCCDGTWNTPDEGGDDPTPTNVTRLARQVSVGPEQVLHYDEGVGTSPGEHLLGGAFGWGLSRNVREAYAFLVEHYEPGDELFLFGFSRGAFTARSLAGMVRNCGILRPRYADQVDVAYALYRSRRPTTHPAGAEAEIFRKTRSYDDVGVHLLGVWDTVGALGIPGRALRVLNRRVQFHDTTLGPSVAAAFQALALDERRGAYEPALWTAPTEPVPAPRVPATAATCDACRTGRQVAQVWFCGAHSDVGGGYADRELADITFRWMAERAVAHGLVLDHGLPEVVRAAGPEARVRGDRVVPLALGRVHDPITWYFRWPRPAPRTVDPPGAVDVSIAASAAFRGPVTPEHLRGAVATSDVTFLADADEPCTVVLSADRPRTVTPAVLTAGRRYAVGIRGPRPVALRGEVGGEVVALRDGDEITAPASGALRCRRPDVPSSLDEGPVTLTITPVGARPGDAAAPATPRSS